MDLYLVGGALFFATLLFLVALLRRTFGIYRREQTQGQNSVNGVAKPAPNTQHITQGEEALALLKALNGNLENRTIKN